MSMNLRQKADLLVVRCFGLVSGGCLRGGSRGRGGFGEKTEGHSRRLVLLGFRRQIQFGSAQVFHRPLKLRHHHVVFVTKILPGWKTYLRARVLACA